MLLTLCVLHEEHTNGHCAYGTYALYVALSFGLFYSLPSLANKVRSFVHVSHRAHE